MQILGIDIGGSSLKAAPVDTHTGRLLAERRRVETPKTLSPRRMAATVADLARSFQWTGPVGIGFPGVVGASRILTSDNLHKLFIGCDGVRLFGRALGGPVALTNDAAAAALAEMTWGAGRGFRGKTLVLTLGTGIGSALCYRGGLFPCELGQLPLHGDDAEKYAAPAVRTANGLSWSEWGARLSEYIAILERIHWPELIVIGGGISAEHRKFFRFVRHRARMVPAAFFNDAGIIGAALWAARDQPQGGVPRDGLRVSLPADAGDFALNSS
jgi:polyphosphate glucokinase